MRIPARLQEDHLLGVRFALNVSLGALVTWSALRALDDRNPIWAIASMIASSSEAYCQKRVPPRAGPPSRRARAASPQER